MTRIGRSLDNPVETYNANVTGTLEALEMARLFKVKKFIFGSSSSVYGDCKEMPLRENYPYLNPQSPYAFQKLMGELLCKSYKQSYGLNTVILRFFNVYGPRMPLEGAYKLVMPIWLEQIRKGEKLTIYGDGTQTRDFTFVDDTVKGIIACLDKNLDLSLPINLCTNVETSITHLADVFCDVFNLDSEEDTDYYLENPRPNEEKRKVGDNTRANEILGWKPEVFIEEGIERLKKEYV